MAAPSGLIVAWPSTAASIPAGWSRVAALDNGNHAKPAAAAGTTGGSNTHTHALASHSHSDGHGHISSNTDGPSTTYGFNSAASDLASDTHTHGITWAAASTTTQAATATSSGATVQLSTFTVIFIQSDGTTDLPSGAVMYWNTASPPTNWAFADGTSTTPDLRLKYLIGANTGADGGTSVAAASHSHTASHAHNRTAHTHGVSSFSIVLAAAGSGAGGINVALTTHSHAAGTVATGSDSTAYGTDATASSADSAAEPAWYKLLPIKKTAADSAVPAGLIGMTVGATPSGFTVCDGTNGTPNLNGSTRYIKCANTTAEIGTTGGTPSHTTHSISHTHGLGAHTHTTSGTTGAGSGSSLNGQSTVASAADGHTHTVTAATGSVSGTATGSDATALDGGTYTGPPFSTTIYVMSLATAAAGASMALANRITSRFVGPQALRYLFRQRYLPDITLTPAVDYNFGPILARMPSRRVGPGGLRPVLQHTVFTDTKTAFPNLGVAFDAALALRNTLAVTFDAVLATGNATSITFDVAPQVQSTITVTLDAALGLLTVTTVTFDAVLATESTVTATFDALLAGVRAATIAFDAIIGVALGPEAGTADPNAGLPPGAAQVADWITPGSGALDSLASGAGGVDPLPGGGGLYTQPQTGSGWQIRP